MSEYFVGADDSAWASPSRRRGRGRHAAPPAIERVRFGVPFNGVVPIWHGDAEITWHRPLDGTDLAEVLGLGLVETEPGPAQAPPGWSERVELGFLVAAGETTDNVAVHFNPAVDGPILRLRAITPSGTRAVNDPSDGVAIPLSGPLSIQEAMGATAADFNITGFCVHVARLMLRAARDGAILLFTLRAPRDPEPHHLLSIPNEVDDDVVMHFHLGTLLEMDGGVWKGTPRVDGMSLLDLDVPYAELLGQAGPDGTEGLEEEQLVALAQPAVDVLLKPGFPFALGTSVVLPDPA